MSQNEKVSYHIDAGGETELGPRAYKATILQYRFNYSETELEKMSADEIDRLFHKLAGD